MTGFTVAAVATVGRMIVAVAAAGLLLAACGVAHGNDALPWLNAQRAAVGLPPYQQDPRLQAKAERDCQIRASRGRSGHLGGSLSPGRAEGVGMRGGSDPEGRRFLSCLQASQRYRYAGAAVVVGRGGTYYQLLLR